MSQQYKSFITEEFPRKLRMLKSDQPPNFGLMTAHHMVEHLIFVTKTTMKRHGEPTGELNKSQQYFRKFMEKGAPFEYRPKEGAKLNPLRTESIEAAIDILESAIKKFYELFDTNPNFTSYSDMMGEFTMAELEFFHYQHYRWHLFQFGLIPEFEAVK